jgi:hypothetical protein
MDHNSQYTPPHFDVELGSVAPTAPEKVNRMGLIVWWVSIPLTVALSLASERFPPPELAAYIEGQYERELSLWEWGVFAYIYVLLIVTIGVYRSSHRGNKTFIAGNLLMYLAAPFAGPHVEHGLGTLSDTTSMAFGAVVAAVCIKAVQQD